VKIDATVCMVFKKCINREDKTDSCIHVHVFGLANQSLGSI